MADVKPLKNNAGSLKEFGTGDTVGVPNGGTGISTATAHGVIIGNGASAMNVTGAGTAGQVLTSNGASADPTFQAASGGAGGVGSSKSVYKSADETVASSTTLQDDNELTFAIGANETWHGQINAMVTANASGGYKFGITAPSGASGNMLTKSSISQYSHVSVPIGTGGGATSAATVNNTNAIHYFTVVNGATPGNVTFRWAQNANFGTGTTVAAGSVLTAIRTA